MWKKATFLLSLLLLWQGLAYLSFYNPILLPPPAEIARAFVALVSSGGLLVDAAMSLKRMAIGFAIAVLLGSSLGVTLALWRTASDYIGTVLELLRPIPPIAWIPIAILWFGIGDPPAIFIVALGSFFPIFVNCHAGVREVDPRVLFVARSFRVSLPQLIADVYFPLSIPYVIAGMRVGLGVGWMSVITAELIGAQNGLGYMMQLNRVLLQTQNVMVGMITVAILGFGMNRTMLAIERAASPWKTNHD